MYPNIYKSFLLTWLKFYSAKTILAY